MQFSNPATRSFVLAIWTGAALLAGRHLSCGQFVAFWDQGPGTNQSQTHPNTTLGNNPLGNNTARFITLKNITNGLPTGVTLTLSNSPADTNPAWVVAEKPAQNPAPGTPLYQTFYYAAIDPYTTQPTNYSYVFFGQSTYENSLRLTNEAIYYTFSGLNSQARYSFRGGAARGGDAAFQDRWTQVEIAGADFFTPRMSPNVLTHLQSSALASNQVAVNFACNHTPETGDMVGWDDIKPGPNGTVSIICTRYAGPVPGGSSAGGPVYAITGLRFEENLLPLVQLALSTNRIIRISWSPPGGLLQQSTILAQWSDCALTNGATLNPTGRCFFRVRQ